LKIRVIRVIDDVRRRRIGRWGGGDMLLYLKSLFGLFLPSMIDFGSVVVSTLHFAFLEQIWRSVYSNTLQPRHIEYNKQMIVNTPIYPHR
jgi:hypothetical protein